MAWLIDFEELGTFQLLFHTLVSDGAEVHIGGSGQLVGKGWALNDLRWANIIVLASGIWTIIDCEYVRPIGSTLPQELRIKRDWSALCSRSTDLYCFGMMLQGSCKEVMIFAS